MRRRRGPVPGEGRRRKGASYGSGFLCYVPMGSLFLRLDSHCVSPRSFNLFRWFKTINQELCRQAEREEASLVTQLAKGVTTAAAAADGEGRRWREATAKDCRGSRRAKQL